MENKTNERPRLTLVYAYTRAQAIADGVLVDVTELAKEAGIAFPTAVTAAVWEKYVRVPKACPWQDETGRLWDLLWAMRCAIAGAERTHELTFQVLVQNTPGRAQPATLKAVCGPGDDGRPVITCMLSHED